MLKDFTISNLLDLNETIAAELFEGKTYPWEVLPEIGEFIMKLGPTLSRQFEYECREGPSDRAFSKPLHRLLIFMDRRSSEKTQSNVTVHLSVEMQS